MQIRKSLAQYSVALGLAVGVMPAIFSAETVQMPTVRIPSVVNTADKELAPWIWLDAADKDNFEFDDAGHVTKWKDSGARKQNAEPSNRRWIGTDGVATRETRYGTWGITNGAPAYCMGELRSGVDLEFPRCEQIRTVFWVGDLARRAFLLGITFSSVVWDFHRQGQPELTGNDNDDYGLFHRGYSRFLPTTSEVRIDGVKATVADVPIKPGARHVILADALDGTPARANVLADDRPPNAGEDRTGGRALSELIIFKTRLSAAEVAQVENYLLAKWQGTTVDVSSEVTVGGGVSYPHVTIGAGAAFVYSGASFASGEPAVEIMGALAKEDGAKLVIRYAGTGSDMTAFRGARPLLVCAESSLTAADFELQGFPEGAELSWTGTTLSVRIPTIENELIPVALTATDNVTAPWVWYDASDSANFLFDEEGGVTNWIDRGARHQNATPSTKTRTGTTAKLGSWGLTNGVPAYCMGDLGSNVDLDFPRCEQIRTVFWVGDLARRAFLLGDTSKWNFHRSGQKAPNGNDNNDYGLFNNNATPFVQTTSAIRMDGETVTYNVPVKPGARHVLVADVGDGSPATASRLADDRPPDNDDRSGGRALSELIIFTNRLSPLDVAHVESYLRAKWMNATERIDAAVDVTDGAAYPNLTLGAGASITVNCDALSTPAMRETPRMTVYGILRRDTAEKIVIRCTGLPKNAALLRCSAVADLDASDFRVEGADKWKVAWEGTTLSLVPPKGLVVVVR